ncbi:DUF167 domain-containing protein [Candidatus Woesearchaeota archaeon]|nr:DUF167 domain-containing protein [Candidatus Woesearchaeota archaeon]
MEIKEKRFKVLIKPNSPYNEVEGFDKSRDAYIVKIKAKPENNKANIELIKFLSKALGGRAKIISGLKSREKLIGVKSKQ